VIIFLLAQLLITIRVCNGHGVRPNTLDDFETERNPLISSPPRQQSASTDYCTSEGNMDFINVGLMYFPQILVTTGSY
jgi:hypothetical protein